MVKKITFILFACFSLFNTIAFAEESTDGKNSVIFILFAIVGVMLLAGVVLLAYMWTKPDDTPTQNSEPTKNNNVNFNQSFQNQSVDRTIKVNTTPSQQSNINTFAITFTSMSGEGAFVAKIKNSLSVGRGSSCDVVLSDNTISSNHAVLTKDGDTIYLEDCNSSNGTLVNGRLISSKTPIKSGDMVIFGKSEYQITF